jgi:putative transposase
MPRTKVRGCSASRPAVPASVGCWLHQLFFGRTKNFNTFAVFWCLPRMVLLMTAETVRFQYRIYPDAEQRAALNQTFGCVRVVFNDVIAARRDARINGDPYPTRGELGRKLTASKLTPERAWLGDVSAVALQQAQADADTAFKNMFASMTGESKAKKVGSPKFRNKSDNHDTARYVGTAFDVTKVNANKALLRLPKMGSIRLELSRDLPSKPTSVTIIRTAVGQYFASFVTRRETEPLPEIGRVVGIDLGLTDLVTMVYSDGTREKVPASRLSRKAAKKLGTKQRNYDMHKARAGRANKRARAAARAAGEPTPVKSLDANGRPVKAERSKALEKDRMKVAAAHQKVADTRKDQHHKLAHRIVHENQVICLETLGIKGLAASPLAKSVHDAAWGILVQLIVEKALRYGRTVVPIGRFEPTSQICSVCGTRSGPKPLGVREWACGSCGVWLDRDYNAGVNIMIAAGQAETLNGCGEGIRLQLAEAILDEASTKHLKAAAYAA